jgi:hypothetical protein
MLYFIAVWPLLLVGCGVVGLGLLHGFRADRFERLGDRTIAALWLGLVVLAAACLAVSLMLPLSPGVGVAILVLLGAGALTVQRVRSDLRLIGSQLSVTLALWFLSLTTAIAALTSGQVTWVDTGLYHYTTIQWLAQAGTVPGLALLFPNFGFTSSWFALAAPLNAEVFGGRVSAVTNGFAYWLAALSCWICVAHCVQGRGRLSDWFWIAFSLIFLPLILGFRLLTTILVSPSPDLPILFLIGIVAWMGLVIAQSIAQPEPGTTPITSQFMPLIVAAGAVTVKLVALPLLGVTSLAIVLARGCNWRHVLLGGTIVTILLSPFLLAGLVTSGCPLYPSGIVCFNFPWTLPPESVNWVAESTHDWAAWYGAPPAGVPRWAWSTWQWVRSERPNQLIVFLMVLSLGSGIWLSRSQRRHPISGWRWVGAIELVGIIFFMATAPFFRFMLAYLLLLPALAIAVFGGRWLERQFPHWAKQSFVWQRLHPRWRQGLPLFLAALLLVAHGGWPSQVFLPPLMKQPQIVQRQVNGIAYFQPEPLAELCWATQLPCSFEITSDVILRDPDRGFRGGFVRKPAVR